MRNERTNKFFEDFKELLAKHGLEKFPRVSDFERDDLPDGVRSHVVQAYAIVDNRIVMGYSSNGEWACPECNEGEHE